MAFRVSKDAERDLDEIFLYWAKRAGLNAADRITDSITDRFWLVGEHPDAGRASDEIAAGVKCFPAGKYLVYYRRTRTGTEILHIFTVLRTRSGPSGRPNADRKDVFTFGLFTSKRRILCGAVETQS